MMRALWTAGSGMVAQQANVDVIANNLANVNTTGYKRDMLSFKDTFAMYAHDQIMEPQVNLRSKKLFPEPQHLSRTRIAQAQVDYDQGSLKITGAPLDVAISGNGFFKVRTPQGDFYTRNGHFRMTGEGMLITEQGFPVLGNGGEITLPEGVKNFTIAENGDIYGDGEPMGSIDLVEVSDPLSLEKLGSNMYRPRVGSDVQEVESKSYMVQGFLEVSNVNPVYEMVNMIEAQRQFEAYAKVMQTTEAIDKETITKVGRSR